VGLHRRYLSASLPLLASIEFVASSICFQSIYQRLWQPAISSTQRPAFYYGQRTAPSARYIEHTAPSFLLYRVHSARYVEHTAPSSFVIASAQRPRLAMSSTQRPTFCYGQRTAPNARYAERTAPSSFVMASAQRPRLAIARTQRPALCYGQRTAPSARYCAHTAPSSFVMASAQRPALLLWPAHSAQRPLCRAHSAQFLCYGQRTAPSTRYIEHTAPNTLL